MGRSWKVCAAGLFVLGMGVLGWLLGPAASGPEASAARPAAGARGTVRAAPELAASSSASASPVGAGRSAVAPSQKPAAAVDDGAVEPPLADGQRVRVVRGRGEEPVAGALVTFGEAPVSTAAEKLAREAYEGPFDAALHVQKRYRADAEGRLRLPHVERYGYAWAEVDGEWGCLLLQPGRVEEESLLRLAPDETLRVRVVSGPERAPVAGAEVGLRYETAPGDSTLLDVASTGPDGVARFEHFSQHTRYYWAHTERLCAVLHGLFAERPEVALDPLHLPQEVELALPPCTELEVRVMDADGAPVMGPALVRVDLAREGALEDLGLTVAAVAREGSIVFRQIGAGLDLVATARTLEAESAEPCAARSAGEPGRRAQAVVRLGAAQTVVSGRLLLPDGTPAAERDARIAVGQNDLSRRESFVRTDAAGGFRFPLDTSLEERALLVLDARIALEHGALGASAMLEGPVSGERNLGDLWLAPEPLLAAGRVVDTSGRPIPGALVRASAAYSGGGFLPVGRVYADAGGAFAIHARSALSGSALSALRLTAEHPRFAQAEGVPVLAGAADVELVLEGAGRIAGSVLFDEEWFCDFARVRATPAGAEEWTEAEIERPGSFSLPSLAPGEWTVKIGMWGEEEGGVTVEGVRVAAGVVCRDPRLQDVDLRGKARYISLSVVDGSGAPLEEAELRYRTPGGDAWNEASDIENGRAFLFTTLSELEVFATAEGCRGAFVPAARDGQEIVLAEGIPVRLRWSEPVPAPVNDLWPTYFFELAEPGLPPLTIYAPIAGEGEKAEVVLFPAAGGYEIVWRLMQEKANRWTMLEEQRDRLVILDRSEPLEYAVSMPATFRARVEAEAQR